MKNILIINGHPNKNSLNFALAESYKKGALESGANVLEINICDLKFNPNLEFGYEKRMDLEIDLIESLEKIKKANHIVWVHPVWWGGFPAIMKGFIDRVFLPTIAFRYRDNSIWWDKLLVGKTSRIITTLDQPSWTYRFLFARPSINQLKKCILEFCGISPVRVTYVENVKTLNNTKITKYLEKINKLGKQLK